MWKEASSNMFRRKGAPALQGSPHMCARTFLMKSCVDCKLTDLHGNFRQYILVRPACIFYFLIVDKNWTALGHLAFRFDPVGRPHTFFSEQCPAFVNQAPEKKRFENGNRLLLARLTNLRKRPSARFDAARRRTGSCRSRPSLRTCWRDTGRELHRTRPRLQQMRPISETFWKHFGNISERRPQIW